MLDTSMKPTTKTNFGTLMLALGVGLALRLIYFIGVSGHDDVDYFNYALDVLDGTFSTEPAADGSFPFRFRIGMIFPTALMFRFFGASEYTAAILPLLNSLGLIWLCWWGGRRISPFAGCVASLLMATFPLAIGLSTSLLPGPFAAFFSSLAVLFWLHTEDQQQDNVLTDKAANFRYLIAGIILGLGYFFRIEVGLFVMFFILYSLVHRRAGHGCILALAGAAAVVVVENLAYLAMHGELLYRLKVVSGGFADLGAELSETVQSKKSAMVYLKYIFLRPTDLGLHWFAILSATIVCLIFRKQERTSFLLWFWPVTLYLFFGSWSISSYVPTSKDPRYLINVTVPGLILLAGLIDQFRRAGIWNKRLSNVGLAGIIAGSLLLLNLVYAYRCENASGSRVAAQFVMQQQASESSSLDVGGPVWCEHHAALALRCLLPHRNIRAVSTHNLSINLTTVDVPVEEINSGIVIVDHFVIRKYVTYSDMDAVDYLMNPPSTWTQMFKADHPTNGMPYGFVRVLNHLLSGKIDGPGQSLRTDPVIIYRPDNASP